MMDSLVFSRSSGNRSISASAAERTLLLGALATHMGVLDTRENDSQTVTRKAELWDEITRHFNSNATTPRSKQQIQTLYKNMKAKARRYEARLAEMANGIPPPDPDPISEMLLGLLQQQLRHQRRHLKNLMARDSSIGSLHHNTSLSPTIRQTSAAFINPEQMMQVFLSEGTREEVDIKSKNCEEELTRTTEPIIGSSSSPAYPETLESAAKPSLPVNLSESVDDSKPSSSPLSLLTDGSHPSSIIDNCNDEDLSPNPSTTHEIDSQNLQAVLAPLVQSPSVTKDGQCKKLNQYPPQSLQNGDFEALTSSLDAIAALKNLHNSEEMINNRSHSQTWSETTSPILKRPCLENFSRHYLASVSKMLCCHPPDSNTKMTCCSPETHSKLLAMAQEEHEIKVTLLKREIEHKDSEHGVKMKILKMEQEEATLRVEAVKKLSAIHSNNSVNEKDEVKRSLSD
ncbi:myb/SANT-like DNA-binding domain-containing protein 3 [Palaemon carinicauda]|uniref:myb/SANT-like DNA-binding domain-containing protein 3 n=1 Tax=Palaemon carinicauda TaxID=392227 RepID=UPI0035B639E1